MTLRSDFNSCSSGCVFIDYTKIYTTLESLHELVHGPNKNREEIYLRKLNYGQISLLFTSISIKVRQNSRCVCV